MLHAGREHGQRAVVNLAAGLQIPGHGRKAHVRQLLEHGGFHLVQAVVHVAAAAGLQIVHDLRKAVAQDALALGVHGDGVGQACRGADHEGYRALPGVGIFDAGHGLVAAAAAAEDDAHRAGAAVDLKSHLPAVLGHGSAGLPAIGVISVGAEHGNGTHVALHKIGAVQEREADHVVRTGFVQTGQLLIRPGEGREVLEETALVGISAREAEAELHIRAGEAAVHIAVGELRPIGEHARAHLFHINKGLLIPGIR